MNSSILFNYKCLIKILATFLSIALLFSSMANQVQAYTDDSFSKNDSDGKEALIPGDTTIDYHFENENFQKIDGERIETFRINIPQLDDREKNIIVYLPSNYSISNKAYPVLYLQSAEQVFIHYGFHKDYWLIDVSFYNFFTSNLKSETIIVGINSDPIHFWEEYSPWINDDMYRWMGPCDVNRVEGGEGDAFLDFLVYTLKPEIDVRYRTLPDQKDTAIGGYDMGGLISIYAGLTRSDVFSKINALSPAIWLAENGGYWLSNNYLIKLIDNMEVPKNVSFSIDVAERERSLENEVRPFIIDSHGERISFQQAYLQGTRAVVETLLKKGVPNNYINYGEFDLDAWSPPIIPSIIEETNTNNIYYFPIFFKQGLDTFYIYIPYENRYRRIWIYLPKDYSRNTKSYPVIYLPNAQYIFGSETGASIPDYRDWMFDEILDEIYDETGQGIIAVGIDFDPDYGWEEYMPWTNPNMDNWLYNVPEVFYGNANKFLNFIISDLKPIIDSRYRTLIDGENTAITGGSRFALFSLYAGLKYPDIFSNVIVFSPTVWAAEGGTEGLPLERPIWLSDNNLLKWFDNNQAPKNVNYYLYTGTKEVTGPPEPYPHVVDNSLKPISMQTVYLSGARALRDKLIYDGIPSENLRYIENPGGEHIPLIWRNYIKSALKWVEFY